MGFFKKLLSNNTLYYPGCLTKIIPKIANQYMNILEDMDIDYITLKEEVCCGNPVINQGYKNDYSRLRTSNYEVFNENRISKIITSCPSCYDHMKHLDDFEVDHVINLIHNNLDKFEPNETEEITYYDCDILARKLEIKEEPRDILKHLGFKIKEVNGCIAAHGGLQPNNRKLADEAAKIVLSKVKTEKLVTACPHCYQHLKNNAPENIKILEFSEVFK